MSESHVRAGRLGALSVHARGLTNTKPARDAFNARFEREVDPDGVLPEAERLRRAEFARRAFYVRLSAKRWSKRR